MSCETERKKRQTYPKVKEMAKKCLKLTQDNLVIYKDKENLYFFCCQTEYKESKGTIIEVLEQP